jgi:Phage integrase SAM-like domain
MTTDEKPSPNASENSSARERTVPLKNSIQKVTGYGTLTIYKIEASPYWYARFYEKGKIARRSLKVTDKREAITAAKDFFAELKNKQINRLPLTRKSGFEVVARSLLRDNEARATRGELSKIKIKFDRARLEKDLLPYFGKLEIAEIDYKCISDYINSLSTKDRPLSINSLKIHLSHIKTIMTHAQRMGVITAAPAYPSLKTVDQPRPWFNSREYTKLHTVCRANIGKVFKKAGTKGEQRRNIEINQELYDLIIFMTNSLIRPSDIKVLKHKHVAIIDGKQSYLRLTYPPTKKHGNPVVTMPEAVVVYKRLLKRQLKDGYGKPEDYLFKPSFPDKREYALRQITRQFDQLLKISDLKYDSLNRPRPLYSLRHTAIMFRLINSSQLDPKTLARNARTSWEMIDRFYGSHLEAEMNVEALQSHKNKPKKED